MKRTVKMFLLAILMLAVATIPMNVLAQTTADPSSHSVLVDGQPVAFRAFTIDGSNFFMLRDIAYVLNGTPNQFEVTWDGSLNAINLLTEQAYTPVGGEMIAGGTDSVEATPSVAIVYVDGNHVNLRAYSIGGNNFFMLRDLGEALGFGVDWDNEARAVVISTDSTGEIVPTPDPTPIYEPEPEPEPIPEPEPTPPVEEVPPAVEEAPQTTPVQTDRQAYGGAAISRMEVIGSRGTVLIIYFTPQVRRNQFAEVTAFTEHPYTAHNLRVRYATGYGTATGLGEVISNDEGHTKWQWRVGGNTRLGSWPITITVDGEDFRFDFEVLESA